jgi:RNA polymerase sigma-70 factor (ECF subfamily)
MTNAPTRMRPAATDQPGDAELVRRSLAGDGSSFEHIFTRHATAIFTFACARVGPDRAEDVTADTFSAAFRSLRNFDQRASSARPWLYGIAANTLRRHGEHEARWLQRLRLDPAPVATDDPTSSDERVDAGRLAPRLARALAELNQGERDVLLLYVLDDLSHEEIARALDIRRGTVKSRLSRGRARIRATFPDLAAHLDTDTNGGTA